MRKPADVGAGGRESGGLGLVCSTSRACAGLDRSPLVALVHAEDQCPSRCRVDRACVRPVVVSLRLRARPGTRLDRTPLVVPLGKAVVAPVVVPRRAGHGSGRKDWEKRPSDRIPSRVGGHGRPTKVFKEYLDAGNSKDSCAI